MLISSGIKPHPEFLQHRPPHAEHMEWLMFGKFGFAIVFTSFKSFSNVSRNPEAKYMKTRHNAGFMLADSIALNSDLNFRENTRIILPNEL